MSNPFDAGKIARNYQLFLKHLPQGQAWQAARTEKTVQRGILEGLATEFYRLSISIDNLQKQADPSQTEDLITEFESSVSIPSKCFDALGTLEERRQKVLLRIINRYYDTEQDWIDLAAAFGVTLTSANFIRPIEQSGFTYTFPFNLAPDEKTSRNTLIVRLPFQGNNFTFTFPFNFGSPQEGLIECLFRQIKPATLQLNFEYTG